MKPDVDRMENTTRAGDAVVELQMPIPIPGETAYRRTPGYTERVEGSGESESPVSNVRPGRAVDSSRLDGHDFQVPPQGGCSIQNHRDRQWNVLHEALHRYVFPAAVTSTQYIR